MDEIANGIDLNLYDSWIDIRCDEPLQAYDLVANINTPIRGVCRDIQNIEATDLSTRHSQMTHAMFRRV